MLIAVPVNSQQETKEYIKNEIKKVQGIPEIYPESSIKLPKDQIIKLREDTNTKDDEAILVSTIDWKKLNNAEDKDNIVSTLLKYMLKDRDEPVKVRIVLTGFTSKLASQMV